MFLINFLRRVIGKKKIWRRRITPWGTSGKNDALWPQLGQFITDSRRRGSSKCCSRFASDRCQRVWSFCVNDLRLERFVSREDSSVSNHYCCRKQENKLEDSGRESSDNKIVQCRREFYKSGESWSFGWLKNILRIATVEIPILLLVSKYQNRAFLNLILKNQFW